MLDQGVEGGLEVGSLDESSTVKMLHQPGRSYSGAAIFPYSKGIFVNYSLQPLTLLCLGTCDPGWHYISHNVFLSCGYRLGSSREILCLKRSVILIRAIIYKRYS